MVDRPGPLFGHVRTASGVLIKCTADAQLCRKAGIVRVANWPSLAEPDAVANLSIAILDGSHAQVTRVRLSTKTKTRRHS